MASLEQKLGFVIPADVGDSEVTDVEEEDAVDFVVSVVLGEVEDEVDVSSATVVIVTVLEVSVQTKGTGDVKTWGHIGVKNDLKFVHDI